MKPSRPPDPIGDRPDWSELVHRRFSARRYLPTPVDAGAVERILAAALAAPSSKDDQPWRWHLAEALTLRRAVADAMLSAPGLDAYVPTDPAEDAPLGHPSSVVESARVLTEAPFALFLENLGGFSGGRQNVAAHPEHLASSLVAYTFEVIGLGASVQNALLAAAAEGLGAVFMGDVVIAETAVRDLLRLRGDLVGVVCVGHPAGGRFEPKQLLPGRLVRHT
jgi:nitroreductase